MPDPTRPDPFRALAARCAAATDERALRADVAAPVRDLTGARAVLVGATLVGDLPDPGPDFAADAPTDRLEPVTVPAGWAARGVAEVRARSIDADTVVVLAWDGVADPADRAGADRALDLVSAHVARLATEHRLADLVERVDNAQQLADMGDYDWHIASDTNRWSDQLYRIYGYVPQSFHPSYEKFLQHIHPDDRDRVTGIHQHAYATGEPYQMIERIVRPDGQVRYLSSNGQVVKDADGTPLRMRGTCIDVTDRVLAEQAQERSTTRFQELVEASPDAIVVVGAGDRVVQANGRAAGLLGGDPVGLPASDLLPWPDAAGQDVAAHGIDGRALELDVTTAGLGDDAEDGLRAAFLRDAAPRLASESLAVAVREAHVRRKQALELNDNVVQGLTAAGTSATSGDLDGCIAYLDRTLGAARRMMNDLLGPTKGGRLEQGDLVRREPSRLDPPRAPRLRPVAGPTDASAPCRVLVVDDNDDIRLLARVQVEKTPGCAVVGEAADGVHAVAMARELQPDVVLLDLAMPRMDGLQALPLLLEAVPGVRVVVMSGFDERALAPRAMDAGAVCYIEKGVRMNLGAVVRSVLLSA